MEQIEQLKAMRDAARARLEATPDYKLSTSLDALIKDLEVQLGLVDAPAEEDGGEEAEAAAEEPSQPGESDASPPGGEEEIVEAEAEPDEQETKDAVAELEKVIAAESEKDKASSQEDDDDPEIDGDALEQALGDVTAAEPNGHDADEVVEDDEDDEDAISRAIQELDADLAKTKFS